MKLTENALKAINNKTTRQKLGLQLDFSEQWIIKLIDANKDNGPLTTAGALKVIREETKLKDSEILEPESVEQN